MEFLSISKVGLYGLFLNYYCYYIITGSFIPHGTMIFLGLTALGIILNLAVNNGIFYVSDNVKLWIIYGFLAFITTYVCYSSSAVVFDIIKYFQRIFIMMAVAYICEQEEDIRFAINLIAATAIGCAYASLTSLGNYLLKLDLTSGADVSTNDIGCIMAFGCFAILFVNFGIITYIDRILKVIAIIAFISVIFLAGSRKSALAVLVCFALLVLFCGAYFLNRQSYVSILFLLLIGIVAVLLIYKNLWPYVEGTDLYQRVLGDHAESAASSNMGRIELYRLAFQDFLNHPLIGDGFNRFVELHGNYTHSTYAEPIACSGLISLFYLLPYGYIFKRQIDLIQITKYDPHNNMWQRALFAFLLAFLLIGVGIPYIYKDIPQVALGLFVASQTITITEYQRRSDL